MSWTTTEQSLIIRQVPAAPVRATLQAAPTSCARSSLTPKQLSTAQITINAAFIVIYDISSYRRFQIIDTSVLAATGKVRARSALTPLEFDANIKNKTVQ